MRLLYVGSHAVLEHDQVKLWSDLGYDVFSIGNYADPANPVEAIRPPIPTAPHHPDLAALCHEQRARHGAEGLDYAIDWAKMDLHPALIAWADVIVVDCFPERWIAGNWPRIRDKRVIWRTIGQSNPEVERFMRRFEGLEIVRYSPRERHLPNFAGETALIRFGKDPRDWYGWTGERAVVTNVSQDLVTRDPFTNHRFWAKATEGLPVDPMGRGSEAIGGRGNVEYDEMRALLRSARCYLYTGTQPASYTLGLIEALMTGIPVVSIGPRWMNMNPWGPALFEAHELAEADWKVPGSQPGEPMFARSVVQGYLDYLPLAREQGRIGRERAIETFGTDTIGRQWLDFLGAPTRTEFAHERETVTA